MARAQELTNSVIITNLPDALFEAALNASLKLHFERAGPLRCWAPMPSFGRVMAVYHAPQHAKQAKLLLDKSIIEDASAEAAEGAKIPTRTLRVYAGPNTPDYLLQGADHGEKHLPVPVTDKNFLISPPGSPPVGWEPIHEDPPNTVTLADDLMRALENLALEQKLDDGSPSQPATPTHSRGGSLSTPGNPSEPSDHLVIPPSPDKPHPAVFVRNMDAHEPPATSNSGITLANSPRGVRRASPTSAPPISHVKATVESMQGSGAQSPSRIRPTARPPL